MFNLENASIELAQILAAVPLAIYPFNFPPKILRCKSFFARFSKFRELFASLSFCVAKILGLLGIANYRSLEKMT
jgi:hypothetical protein